MDFLILASEFPPIRGGIATFGKNLSKGLHEAGHTIRVVTSAPEVGAAPSSFAILRAPAWLNAKGLKIFPLLLMALWQCFWRRPDVVVSMKLSHEAIVAYFVCLVFQLRHALIVHGGELKYIQHPVKGPLLRVPLRTAHRVFANSRFTMARVEEWNVGPRTITLLHPPVEPSDYSQEGTPSSAIQTIFPGRRLLLTVGKLTKHKGHDRVLKAIKTLLDRYPDLAYVIAGDGPDRATLERLVVDLEISNHVYFAGSVSKQDLMTLYSRCDIYVMPSWETATDVEGFGIAFLEANLFGKPAIAGRSGGTEDSVLDGVSGFRVDPRSDGALEATIGRLLEDQALRTTLGKQGRARVLKEFDVKSAARAFTMGIAAGGRDRHYARKNQSN